MNKYTILSERKNYSFFLSDAKNKGDYQSKKYLLFDETCIVLDLMKCYLNFSSKFQLYILTFIIYI